LQVGLEIRVAQLQSENNSLLQKEVRNLIHFSPLKDIGANDLARYLIFKNTSYAGYFGRKNESVAE